MYRRMSIGFGPSLGCALVAAAAMVACPAQVQAQVACGQSLGPDLIISDINGIANYTSLDGIEAFMLGVYETNIGSVPLAYENLFPHPVYGSGLFRLKTVDGAARFEQIGQSWLHHGFAALQTTQYCGQGACTPTGFDQLGSGCSSPNTAATAGTQAGLGPKWQVNPDSGVFPYPPASPPWSGSIARRLQAHITDIDPAQNLGALYYVEAQSVAPDDSASVNQNNNASRRRVVFGGTGEAFSMSFSGTTAVGEQAIRAWKANDPAVVETDLQVIDDGLFIVAARATSLGNGQWRYEYAVQNMNSYRAGGSFSVPIPAGASVTNIGFHDVDYHSGDGLDSVTFSGTDWTSEVGKDFITWTTEAYVDNSNANALRWGTLYNFRFDADAPPADGDVTIGLFIPTIVPEGPFSVSGATIVPSNTCVADVNATGDVDIDDLFEILSAWGTNDPVADVNDDEIVNIDDLFFIIGAWGPC